MTCIVVLHNPTAGDPTDQATWQDSVVDPRARPHAALHALGARPALEVVVAVRRRRCCRHAGAQTAGRRARGREARAAEVAGTGRAGAVDDAGAGRSRRRGRDADAALDAARGRRLWRPVVSWACRGVKGSYRSGCRSAGRGSWASRSSRRGSARRRWR